MALFGNLLRADRLSNDEQRIFNELMRRFNAQIVDDTRHDRYYEGLQRLSYLGIAVPPELRKFETVINVPRMAVDEVERRMDVKWLSLPGENAPNEKLGELWRENNLDSDLSLLIRDMLIYGRALTTVGGADAPGGIPMLRVEDVRTMAYVVEPRTRTMTAALRVYTDVNSLGVTVKYGTLYLPDATISLTSTGGAWVVTGRQSNPLGRVPVILHLNRRRTGDWRGVSEMRDVIGLTDNIARTLTNLQVALETHALPPRWVAGMSKGDFTDAEGKPLPMWKAYFNSFMATGDKDVEFGQFPASSLDNFHSAVNNMLSWCATSLGLPTRYTGQAAANPATEGAINADERRLIKNVERKCSDVGSSIGWWLALGWEVWTGQQVDGNMVHAEWFDASTPTRSERADAIQKLTGGIPILSRRGAWDELGWSTERQERELEFFREESAEDDIGLMVAKQAMLNEGQANTGDAGALVQQLLDHLGLTAEDLGDGTPPAAA